MKLVDNECLSKNPSEIEPYLRYDYNGILRREKNREQYINDFEAAYFLTVMSVLHTINYLRLKFQIHSMICTYQSINETEIILLYNIIFKMNSFFEKCLLFGGGAMMGTASAYYVPWQKNKMFLPTIASCIPFGVAMYMQPKFKDHQQSIVNLNVYSFGNVMGYIAYSYIFSSSGKWIRNYFPIERNIIPIVHHNGSFFSNTESSIGLETSHKFIKAYENADKSKDIHIIIHTPGGALTAVESIVNCILNHTGEGRFIAHVPYYAYSGGCAISLACHEIRITTNTVFGPCDAQIHSSFKQYSISSIINTVNAKRDKGEPIKEEWMTLSQDAEICRQRQREFLQRLVEEGRIPQAIEDKIYEELFSGKYNHDTAITADKLLEMGLNITVVEKFENDILKYIEKD